jgi:hypothetical protein
MGFYLLSTGPTKGKAEVLKKDHGAKVVSESEAALEVESMGVVCVVYNQTWDAAGFAFNLKEFARMLPRPDDQRPRRWMVMDRREAELLSGYSV